MSEKSELLDNKMDKLCKKISKAFGRYDWNKSEHQSRYLMVDSSLSIRVSDHPSKSDHPRSRMSLSYLVTVKSPIPSKQQIMQDYMAVRDRLDVKV